MMFSDHSSKVQAVFQMKSNELSWTTRNLGHNLDRANNTQAQSESHSMSVFKYLANIEDKNCMGGECKDSISVLAY
jgi:hypothetical protein